MAKPDSDIVFGINSQNKKNTDLTKLLLISVGIAIFLFFTSITIGVRFLYSLSKTLPNPKQLSSVHPSLVTKVFAADSSILYEFSIEKREWVSLKDIPLNLQHAVVAIEDRKFYNHKGIDIKRIISATLINIIKRDYAQGASTLTQQLARNLYFSHKQTIIRKLREILTAIQLETYYTKDEILELYLNMVYLGGGAYGVEAASQKYFSKSVKDLNLNECAILAGCIQLPEYYRPDKKKNIKRTTIRRNSVIRAMKKMGFITDKEANDVIAMPVKANTTGKSIKKPSYFVEMVRQYVEKKYGETKLYKSGLKIYTTLDPIAQDSTEKAVRAHLDTLQKYPNALFLDSTKAYKKIGVSRSFFLEHFDSLYSEFESDFRKLPDSLRLRKLQASVVAIDVKTGAIKVLVGGYDFSQSKYNRAVQALRQPGSSFKPFVYTVAIDTNYTPATVVMDQPITLETPEGPWRPENYEHKFYGPITIRDALKHSVNLVAIQVLMDIGIMKVIKFARKLGFKHRLAAVPSLAIGSCEVTNLEMTRAYSIFPGYGYEVEPFFIKSIVDKHGRVLEKNEIKKEKVLSSQTAYLITSMLQTVINSGTGASARRYGFTRPAGGKTGTTNNYSDAWFIGFTPQIVCGVWVGTDEHRSMGIGVTGAKGAIPIWVAAMKSLHKNLPVKSFNIPEGIVKKRVCSESHKIAGNYCPDVYEEYFDINNIPVDCDIHTKYGVKKKKSIINRFGTTLKPNNSNNTDKTKTKTKRSLIF